MGIALRIHAVATSRTMQVSTALGRTVALGLAVAVAACSSGATSSATPSPSSKYPNAIAVPGHSGATGFDSNPDQPGVEQGHNVNVAVSGSDVDNLASQA